MKRKHEMPFGAECRHDGSVRFRLWAPHARSVQVALEDSPQCELAMPAVGEGWFEVSTQAASAGTRYSFKIDNLEPVPDPASRFQPTSVHGPSEVIDPRAFEWTDAGWHGRPWRDVVIYEMHTGTFTPEGTFAAAQQKLDYLASLGVTSIEIMPVSSFPGERNWGYDGVLPYAPTGVYGRPGDLKRFINAAHAKNLLVFLDAVYNHFGPEGNYLPLYAPQFFTDRHHTPWGRAINFDGPGCRVVRDYFIHNALYWLEEFHFDGLRFDAVHAIVDDSHPDFLTELAETIRNRMGGHRYVHLILENGNNAARYLCRAVEERPRLYTAQWNDDIHHALHVLLTGEKDGYYGDYAENAAWHLGRALAEGFSYQGEPSEHHGGQARGEPCRELPPGCFVSFLQNHDQIGNRALGERITRLANPAAVRAALACLLLAPSTPLLFMGEEFGAETPFLFFCDFGPELASKVRDGRRSEFSKFAQFSSPEARARIPDPNSPTTFAASKLRWASLEPGQSPVWLEFHRELLAYRRNEIVPRIAKIRTGAAQFEVVGEKAVSVDWPFTGGGGLHLRANFAAKEIGITKCFEGRLLYSTADADLPQKQILPPYSAAWLLNE
jgi:malto-oligosyltrehalose trehalohydrolase